MFKVSEKEAYSVFNQLPVILLDNLSTNDLKIIKNQLIFLSNLGLTFNITPKKMPNLTKKNWKLQRTLPIVNCPSCGEYFYLIRSQDFHHLASQKTKSDIISEEKISDKAKIKSYPAKNLSPQDGAALQQKVNSEEFDNIEILSAELDSIVEMEEDEKLQNGQADEESIEEVESISDELEEIDSLSKELDQLNEEDPDYKSDEFLNIRDAQDSIGGISAEFEEIEGVSAEFEKICMEDMENDIGSLSAEFDEIDGISAEFDSIDDKGLDRIGEAQNFIKKSRKNDIYPQEDDDSIADEELDELEGISDELDEISDRNNRNIRTSTKKYNVVVNFSQQEDIEEAVHLVSQIKGINYQEATELVKNKQDITVANKISHKAAKTILNQFQRLNATGKINVDSI